MRKDKKEARELRQNGKSYKDITNLLGIPKSTLSGWFGAEDWSQNIKKKLTSTVQVGHTIRTRELSNVRGQQLEKAYSNAELEASDEFESLKYNPIFIAALMLYWGEGAKTGGCIKLSNTDPEMIKLFKLFLVKVCNIPTNRIKGHLVLYPDLNDKLCRNYWSSQTTIPKDNFTKSTLIKGRHKTRRLPYGVCTITVSSKYFFTKMAKWREMLPQTLMSQDYYENM